MAVSDWLYRNGYGWIYEEWLESFEHTFQDMLPEDYLKKHYPKIWQEYNNAMA